ncbi:MAG: electron transport complex subunit RsxB [Aquabacterium sp.]|uniref:electron transport complex subunit RsxB n=1 Tax=Aquabacterium sp. TaxID=1872578 RepID=UPI002717FADA|nr:electron transport complex subunit RsxB [Aquabacterium sp.]MDO9003810.1 electron transport complex subunit RsxB [Aquabacterium sp.]
MLDAARINALLPQTQCTRCGFPDCASYARAIVAGEAGINQCPPGGDEGIQRLAQATGLPALPLSAEHGEEGPRFLAVIDETWCIGCTLCIKACPVDCIIGAPKQMHTVIEDLCTGCELCIPACPVDCISLVPASNVQPAPTGWAAWSAPLAHQAQGRHEFHQWRVEQARRDNDARLQAKAERKLANLAEESRLTEPAQLDEKRAVIEAALARARARRGTGN